MTGNTARPSVHLTSVTTSLPCIRRGNDYYRANFPEMVERVEESGFARAFAPYSDLGRRLFDEAMRPYSTDPFRGAVHRWVLGDEQSPLDLQEQAARRALDAVGLSPKGIDLLISCSAYPVHLGFGDGAWLAQRLGIGIGAFNIQAHAGEAPAVLGMADAMIRAGCHRTILVVFSSTYSRMFSPDDPAGWFVSDGVAACVMSIHGSGPVLRSVNMANTGECSDVLVGRSTPDGGFHFSAGKNPEMIANKAESYLRTTMSAALQALSLAIDDIHTFFVNANLASMAKFISAVLQVPPDKIVDTFPDYGNMAIASPLLGICHAGIERDIPEGAPVAMFSCGPSATAATAVFEWSRPHLSIEKPTSSLSSTAIER